MALGYEPRQMEVRILLRAPIIFVEHRSHMHTEETRARAYEKVRARRLKWFAENGPCALCLSAIDLQMHHVDPSNKEGHSIWSWSDQRRTSELEKCVVLCQSCHSSLHWPKKMIHGAISTYENGCRCEPCVATNRARQKLARDKKKALKYSK